MQEMKNILAHWDVKYLPLTIGDTESYISFCDAVKEQFLYESKVEEEINQAMQEMKNISAHWDVKYLPLTIGDTESYISFCDAVKEQYE